MHSSCSKPSIWTQKKWNVMRRGSIDRIQTLFHDFMDFIKRIMKTTGVHCGAHVCTHCTPEMFSHLSDSSTYMLRCVKNWRICYIITIIRRKNLSLIHCFCMICFCVFIMPPPHRAEALSDAFV